MSKARNSFRGGLPCLRFLGVIMVMACSARGALPQKVTAEADRAVDFSKFKTFNIVGRELNSKNPALNSDLVKKQLDSDIEHALEAKGMEMTTVRPDLNIRYHLGSARRSELESYPAGWYGLGTRVVRVPYSEGTLVIDLRDPNTRSLVWRGIATDQQNEPSKLQGKLDDMVKKSFEKYPPKEK